MISTYLEDEFILLSFQIIEFNPPNLNITLFINSPVVQLVKVN